MHKYAFPDDLSPVELDLHEIANNAVFDVQPTALLKTNETFDVTSLDRFTIITEGVACVPTIAGGQMTMVHDAGQNTGLQEGTDLTMCQFSNVINIASVTSVAGNTYENFGVGVAKDANNFIMAVWMRKDGVNGQASIQVKIGGVSNFRGIIALGAAWVPPFDIGLSLVANSLTFWYKANGGTWTKITSYDVTATFDFKSESLVGWKGVFWLATDNVQTVTAVFDNFKIGYFGSVGFRDPAVVSRENGDPIVSNNVVTLTATLTDPQASAYQGVMSLNLITRVMTQIAVIMVSRSGKCQNDHAGHIISYLDGTYRYFVSTWGDRGGAADLIQILYKNETVLNLLSGANLISGMSQLNLQGIPAGGGAYDPHAILRGGTWYVAYTTNPVAPDTFYPALDSTPDLAIFTLIGADASAVRYEGTRIIKMGVNFWVVTASVSDTNVYDLTMTYQGKMSSLAQAAGAYPPHPMLVPTGSYVYQITFDNTLYGGVASTVGHFRGFRARRRGVR